MNNTIKAEKELYLKYKEEMIDLYIEAFYHNTSTKTLRQAIGAYFDRIFECGFGIFSINKSVINGLMLITPPSFDKNMPLEITTEVDLQKTLYIAEVFIRKDSRGSGYGKQLMTHLFDNTNEKDQTFIIRVLPNNAPAIALYENFSFEKRCTIMEKKLDLNQNKIELEKLYLVRNR